jgi:hypothetical protein
MTFNLCNNCYDVSICPGCQIHYGLLHCKLAVYVLVSIVLDSCIVSLSIRTSFFRGVYVLVGRLCKRPQNLLALCCRTQQEVQAN